MDTQVRTNEFFRAGGTLPPNAPSYITRPADNELFGQLMAGQFCYVLTSRQRGKSSLMIRTAERLRQAQITPTIIDLSGIGTHVSQNQWYLGIVTRLARELEFAIETEQWWRERAALSPIQRFIDFLRDVVLAEVSGHIVIFFDEIDSTLKIDFSDDFFAAIRAMYNLRATDPQYNRLTFVLLGVATPTDLIKDRNRTPFNIGHAIELQELSRDDVRPLQKELDQLYPGQGHRILDRIFHWTNGHPYLTQKLCSEIAEQAGVNWSNAEIDSLVHGLFFSQEARKESNIRFVRSSIEASPDRRQLLRLYRQVHEGKSIPEDERSPLQTRLRLIGLICVKDGILGVRNEIYRQIFDMAWIKASTPINWLQIASISAVLLALAALVTAIVLLQQQQAQKVAEQIAFASDKFRESSDADVQMSYLAAICDLQHDYEAQNLFFERLQGEQAALFDHVHAKEAGVSLVAVVRCLYPAIETRSQAEHKKTLGQAMSCALYYSGQAESTQLRVQIGYTGPCIEKQYNR
jgi:hypothetical protein